MSKAKVIQAFPEFYSRRLKETASYKSEIFNQPKTTGIALGGPAASC